MSLSVGIVGLPNVGKSTLFNALLKRQQAYAANFPFATIEPNVGVVPVPDYRLEKLATVVASAHGMASLPPLVFATVEFVDIAGLIAGAHKGEGLGNKFLGHIREVDAILHVVRSFANENIIREGSTSPASDFAVVETELGMADLETLEKQPEPKGVVSKEGALRWSAVLKLRQGIGAGRPAREVELTPEEALASRDLFLLTSKPTLVALNVDEAQLKDSGAAESAFASLVGVLPSQVIAINALVEEELASFSPEEAQGYLASLGVADSGLQRIITKAFATLGLITFLTAGEKEVRAWTIKQGTSAPLAAGVIHTDFISKFIKADVCTFADFVSLGGWKGVREAGKVRQEGRDYLMREGDVVEFKIGS